jgi:hypothetical protein
VTVKQRLEGGKGDKNKATKITRTKILRGRHVSGWFGK